MQVYNHENGYHGEFETMLMTIITHDGYNDDNVNDYNDNTGDDIDDKDEKDHNEDTDYDNADNSNNDDTDNDINDDNLREFPWPQPGPASPHILPPLLLTIQDWWDNIILELAIISFFNSTTPLKDNIVQAYDPNMAAYTAMLQSMYGLSIACWCRWLPSTSSSSSLS